MRLSVCLGCGPVFFFKQMNEVVRVFAADFQRDFMNLFFCGEKQALRSLHPFPVQVSDGRHAENGGKFMADPELAHMTVLFQILQFQGTFQIVVYVMFQFPQIGGAFLLPVLRVLRIEGSCKKLCQNISDETGVPKLAGQRRAGFTGKKQFQVSGDGRLPFNLRKNKCIEGSQRFINGKKPPPNEKVMKHQGNRPGCREKERSRRSR